MLGSKHLSHYTDNFHVFKESNVSVPVAIAQIQWHTIELKMETMTHKFLWIWKLAWTQTGLLRSVIPGLGH